LSLTDGSTAREVDEVCWLALHETAAENVDEITARPAKARNIIVWLAGFQSASQHCYGGRYRLG
jgi:hypothetical protein